ncbi:hypothetical protein Arcve_0015 [Archaeoglobus veneficus SNP6]|uniref:Uncharacterized protein n=2 Tax=root TaxID=1 RepID=F2KMG0_ARCVS|nr:hypothetical protein Arcve_0015 [Archaeoglobus veneficus SNP6]
MYLTIVKNGYWLAPAVELAIKLNQYFKCELYETEDSIVFVCPKKLWGELANVLRALSEVDWQEIPSDWSPPPTWKRLYP